VRTLVGLLPLALAIAAPAAAQQAAPSTSVVTLRDTFEAEILAIEGAYGNDHAGLLRAAVEAAQRVYGSDWDAVRAEAQRSLAALPTIDLAPYAHLDPVRPFADKPDGGDMLAFAMGKSKWAFAAMRFWDAQNVAAFIGAVAPLKLDGDTPASLGVKMTLVPMRAYRGRLDGADVLAARNGRSLVVAGYSLTPDGLILPELVGVRIYPLQRQ
jgi:hypothetical protein